MQPPPGPQEAREVKMKRKPIIGWLLLAPAVLWIFLIVAYPFASAIKLSFMKTAFGFGHDETRRFENYRQVLSDTAFWSAALTSLWWTLGNLVLQLSLPMFVALLLRRRFAGRNIVRSLILTPWIIPAVVTAILWRWLLEPTVGIVNPILQYLHLAREPISFLGHPNVALISIILINTWRFAPLGTVLILAALQTIPEVLYEGGAGGRGLSHTGIRANNLSPLGKRDLVRRIIGVDLDL